jgi:cytochrome bd-type quinol oxidase subunit 2
MDSTDSLLVLILGVTAVVLVVLVYFIRTRRWARKSKAVVFSTRATACILIQIIAIIAALSTITPHDDDLSPAEKAKIAKDNATSTLMIVAIITVDALLVVIVALYKSQWVEPLMR